MEVNKHLANGSKRDKDLSPLSSAFSLSARRDSRILVISSMVLPPISTEHPSIAAWGKTKKIGLGGEGSSMAIAFLVWYNAPVWMLNWLYEEILTRSPGLASFGQGYHL